MTEDTPKGPDGAKLCAWCGGEIRQSGVGRSRDYCRQSCRQRAYEERKIGKRIAQAVIAYRVSSRDEQRSTAPSPSRDETDSPRDETASPLVKRGKRPTAAPPSMSLPTEWRAVPPARPALPLPTERRSQGRRQLTPPIRREPTLFDEGTDANPQVDG